MGKEEHRALPSNLPTSRLMYLSPRRIAFVNRSSPYSGPDAPPSSERASRFSYESAED